MHILSHFCYARDVDDMPYWTDAIGQIPFAVDKVTDELENDKSIDEAVNETMRVGKKFGEGKLFGGTPDNSNEYDNYFILRGALNGTTGRDFTEPIKKDEANKHLNSN